MSINKKRIQRSENKDENIYYFHELPYTEILTSGTIGLASVVFIVTWETVVMEGMGPYSGCQNWENSQLALKA